MCCDIIRYSISTMCYKVESKVACDVLMHCLLNPMQNLAICFN
jgi:hypothetical protein